MLLPVGYDMYPSHALNLSNLLNDFEQNLFPFLTLLLLGAPGVLLGL
jgi:hypothetical protein